MKKGLFIKIVFLAIACFASNLAFADEMLNRDATHTKPREAFIVFYMGRCPHCQRFDPVLKAYALKHHIPVLAYTLDGRSLPSFPQSVLPSQAEMNRFFPQGNAVVPTLFLMNFAQHKIFPVLQGEASMHQLEARLQTVHAMDAFHDE